MKCKAGKEREYARKHQLLMYSFSNADIDPPPTEEERVLCDATWKQHKQAGIKNYSIFMKGTDLYAYFESEDCARSLDLATAGEIGRKWQDFMSGILEQENNKPVFDIIDSEVFHMD
jgi:L-rhamnose mutarotase